MSEPDFEAIAVGIMNNVGLYDDVVTKLEIAAQLRQVWNARGAADAHLFAGDMDHRDIRETIAELDR